MFPPVHAGVGYLCYRGYTAATGRQPDSAGTLAVVFGSLLADLVDQPLYHLLDLPSTRTLAHSLLVVLPVVLVVLLAVRHSTLPPAVGVGFAIGYLAHPPADALWPLLLGNHEELGFLLWPLTHSPAYVGQKDLFVLGEVSVTTLWVELPILLLALFVWWRDDRPGLDTLLGGVTGDD